jgi:TolA-binding protein
MKKTMETRRWIYGLMAAICVLGIALPPRAAAQVSLVDFNALKEAVQKLTEQVQGLQQTNVLREQIHEKDVQKIQQLEEKVAETQQIATNAEQKSLEAAQAQPPQRQPIDEATVNHNFMILGDAEIQYAKSAGQHGAFVQADFAPIFLYRGGDNILFEAGFDTMLQNGQNADGTHDSGSSTSFNLSFAQLD